jgi:hypothetical protein
MATQLNNMGEIIGWKFNHMSGMSTYDGWITEFPSGVSGVTYADGIPNDANIATWKTEYDAMLVATAYVEDRIAAYAEISEQLDLLYHDMAADKGDKSGEWFKAVKKVKDDNAKPD